MAPRMIQSMEILRMANAELEEKVEQELIENPILEKHESDPEGETAEAEAKKKEQEKEKEKEKDVDQKELVIEEDNRTEDDFERLLNLDREVPDHFCLLYTSDAADE